MAEPDQSPSATTGTEAEHYAYCKDAVCPGCLPSDEALSEWDTIALWGEMLARCIAQTPATKTHDGALAAIIAGGPGYRALSLRLRTTEPGGRRG